MKTRYLLLIILVVITAVALINNVLALDYQCLPNPVRIDSCITLKASCDNCTRMSIEGVDYPNQSVSFNQSRTMQRMSSSLWSYNYCTTPTAGIYTYHVIGDLNGINTSMNPCFEVNAQGINYTSVQGSVYIILLVVLIGFFLLALYWYNTIETGDSRSQEGTIISINWNKYYKAGAFMLIWLLIIAISYFSWNISYGILQFDEMARFFYFIFRISFILMFPIFVFTVIYWFIKFLRDKKLEEMIGRNLTIR